MDSCLQRRVLDRPRVLPTVVLLWTHGRPRPQAQESAQGGVKLHQAAGVHFMLNSNVEFCLLALKTSRIKM
jgi:hypothetical protein